MNKANRMHINQTADHCMKYESYLWHDDRAFAGIIVAAIIKCDISSDLALWWRFLF